MKDRVNKQKNVILKSGLDLSWIEMLLMGLLAKPQKSPLDILFPIVSGGVCLIVMAVPMLNIPGAPDFVPVLMEQYATLQLDIRDSVDNYYHFQELVDSAERGDVIELVDSYSPIVELLYERIDSLVLRLRSLEGAILRIDPNFQRMPLFFVEES